MDDCGSKSAQLEQLLKEYQSQLELDNPDSDMSEVHSFGPYNFYKEHNKFKTLLNGILSRCKQCKSWSNSKQAIKSFGDRQQQIKLLLPLKTFLTECLDKLESVILENHLTDTIHHLEMITRQVGLKFDVSPTLTECFISSDMFYVEVQLEENGNILEVKVAHAGESVTSPVLTSILGRRDYNEFLKHMQGLANLYQLSGDAFQKSKMFLALVTLEKDLEKIAHSESNASSFEDFVLRSPVGVLTPRQGGQLMRLTYFAKPVELRGNNVPTLNDLHSLSISDFGRSLSISVEQSKLRLLPTSSLFSETRKNYLPINEANGEKLPASFVLRLDKPLVVSASVLEKMHSLIENFEGEKFVQNSKAHMDSLIIKKWLKERGIEYRAQMTHKLKLPGEEHVYRISEINIKESILQNNSIGVVISRIPFTHCKNVVEIIQLLRQQLVYNELLTSVLSSRPTENEESDNKSSTVCFDVSTCSPFTVVVTFQEPITFSLASVEFQVKRDCSIGVKFKFSPQKNVFYDCGYVARVAQRCLSIPVTMKYVLKKGRNVQTDEEYKMTVSDNSEVSKRNFTTPPNQSHTQTNAAMFLSRMIGSTGPLVTNTNSVLSVPLLSPSPTLPNFLTPSPTRSTFLTGQETGAMVPEHVNTRHEESTLPRPSIKIKLKKVASSDKYVIETPRSATTLTTANNSMNLAPTNMENSELNMTQFHVNNDLLQAPSNIVDQKVDFSSPQMQFDNLDNFGNSLLGKTAGGNLPGASGVADVENIFQTLPGGATASPGALEVDNPYGFDPGLVDPTTFDINTEMDEANVAGVATDTTAFDMGNVYDPGASTSSTSAMVGSFDIDSTFDLDKILSTNSQPSESVVTGDMSLDWNLGNDGQ